MIKAAVFGAGRMAQEVVLAAAESGEIELVALVSRKRPAWLFDIPHFTTLQELETQPDLLVDFTLSGGTFDAAHWCRARLVPLVSGTTGLQEPDRSALLEASELVPVMWAPNLSKGLNLMMRSVIEAAASMTADTPVEILDIHHLHKRDAPSGTALLLAQAIASARNQDIDDCLVIADSASQEAEAGKITCHSRREGEAIGEHSVRFLGSAEGLSFTHQAESRGIYASGSLEAGRWLVRQPAGLYTSSDWLANQ